MACCLSIRWNKGTFIRIPFSPCFSPLGGQQTARMQIILSSLEGPQGPQCIFPLCNASLFPFWVGTSLSEINKEAIVLLHHSSLVKLIWTSLIIGVSITDLRNLCGPPTIIQLLSYGSETSSDQIHINHVLLLTCSSDPVAKIKLG
jgi:hypothetical protein